MTTLCICSVEQHSNATYTNSSPKDVSMNPDSLHYNILPYTRRCPSFRACTHFSHFVRTTGLHVQQQIITNLFPGTDI